MGGVVILCSGGLDSTVLLHHAKDCGMSPIMALSVDYGQLHNREIDFAQEQARIAGVDWRFVNARNVYEKIQNPLLGQGDIPRGSYAEQQKGNHGAVKTYVPNRNMIFLSIAAAHAIAHGISTIGISAHKDDFIDCAYPDTSPEFIEAMNAALLTQGISVWAPFNLENKASIVKRGDDLGVDFARTWSCYSGEYYPCGVCGTCIDRAIAFEKNGLVDPLLGK